MNKSFFTILVLVIGTTCFAQTSQTKYYSNENLRKETTAEKGKFSKTVTHNADGTVTKEIKNLSENKIINSETYKGDEPFGIWKYQYVNALGEQTGELNYHFNLKYADQTCSENLPGIKDIFKDNDSLKYIAPKLSTNEKSIGQFIAKHLHYPVSAREHGIMGTVYLTFTISKEGIIEDIAIVKGVDISLDKEAVRVIRLLKFVSPPILNGEPQSVCMKTPFKFVIER